MFIYFWTCALNIFQVLFLLSLAPSPLYMYSSPFPILFLCRSLFFSSPERHIVLKMRRNCNSELRLFPCHGCSHNHQNRNIMLGESNDNESQMSAEDEGHHQHQKLTIFYDDKVCVSEVTDLQARWIMKEAGKEMEEKMKRSLSFPSSSSSWSQDQSQMCSPNYSALSMKRSLQRFLQKRKDRIHESSPYHP